MYNNKLRSKQEILTFTLLNINLLFDMHLLKYRNDRLQNSKQHIVLKFWAQDSLKNLNTISENANIIKYKLWT